jgi:hypothetical protein
MTHFNSRTRKMKMESGEVHQPSRVLFIGPNKKAKITTTPLGPNRRKTVKQG